MGACERSDQARPDGFSFFTRNICFAYTLYELAEQVFSARVEQLQQAGKLLKPTQITSEEEQDEHFEILTNLYRETYAELRLAWPPKALRGI